MPSGASMRVSRFALHVVVHRLVLSSAWSLPPARARIRLRRRSCPSSSPGGRSKARLQASKDAAAADPTNAALLKEYGFTDFEAATYKSDDGRTLKIRAARFADASGAFGAYTFYLQPEMAREEIGDQGASLNQRVLFYRGHIVVDAVFSQLSVMSAAGLRELAGVLPRPGGNAGQPASDSGLHAAPRLRQRIQKNMRRDRWLWPRSRLRFPRTWSISAPAPKSCSGSTPLRAEKRR